MTACQWMKERPRQFGRDAPVMDETLQPGTYDFTHEGFWKLWIKYVLNLLIAALLPARTLQSETPFLCKTMFERRWKLRQLAQWLTFLELLPDPEDVSAAHGRMRRTIRQIQDAGTMCATLRLTCKEMAAFMAAEWAMLACLFVTPDIPGKREGAGYHQGKAWSILFDLLGAMGCQTYVFVTFAKRDVSGQSTGSGRV